MIGQYWLYAENHHKTMAITRQAIRPETNGIAREILYNSVLYGVQEFFSPALRNIQFFPVFHHYLAAIIALKFLNQVEIDEMVVMNPKKFMCR